MTDRINLLFLKISPRKLGLFNIYHKITFMKNLFRQFGYKLINFIKHIMAFKDIFKKSSDFNEKTIIGFLSFAVMVAAIVVDLVTGYLGRPLELNEYIFDAFMWIVLGSFLPDVLEKFAEIRGGKKNNNEE